MNRNILAPVLATSLLLGGCSTQSHDSEPPAAPASSSDSINMTCDPNLDSNYVTTPPEVLAERNLPWIAGTSKIGSLTLTYLRDCSIEVRGPATSAYREGPLLNTTFCNGPSMFTIGGDLSAENKMLSPDQQISDGLIAAEQKLEPALRQSTACTMGRIAVIN